MLITQGSLVRAQLDPPSTTIFEDPGGLAQLGEHLLCKQGVVGSIPSSSTNDFGFVLKVLLKHAIIFDSTQKQSLRDCFCVDRYLTIIGCSLKIHRVEIRVVSGNCTFVKV